MQYLGTLIPLFQKGYIIQTENQPGNNGFEQHCRPKGPNGHIHRTSDTHSSQACMEHFIQETICPQNKSANSRRLKSYQVSSLTTMV